MFLERFIMKITKITRKNGSIAYRSQIYLGTDVITGKKVKATITANTQKELKRLARQRQETFNLNGQTVHKIIKADTFKELSALWFDTYKPTVKPQTYKATSSLFNKHIIPHLGAIKISKISTPLCQDFVNRTASSGYKEYKNIIALVRRVLQYAVSLQLLPFNPMLNTIVPKVRRDTHAQQKTKYLTQEEVRQFLDYLDNLPSTYVNQYDTILYKLLLATGLRIGEALALTWSDIDLEGGTVTVNKTLIGDSGTIGTPKSPSAYRTISIDKKTVLMLRLYKNRQAQYFKEIGFTSQVVFATGRTEYGFRHNAQKRLNRHLQGAGIPRFTFHAFRHTHASLLLNAGIGYKELQHRLGHSKISMTLDIYSHLSKDKEKEAVTYYEKALNSL